jgi:hypothetical protein
VSVLRGLGVSACAHVEATDARTAPAVAPEAALLFAR